MSLKAAFRSLQPRTSASSLNASSRKATPQHRRLQCIVSAAQITSLASVTARQVCDDAAELVFAEELVFLCLGRRSCRRPRPCSAHLLNLSLHPSRCIVSDTTEQRQIPTYSISRYTQVVGTLVAQWACCLYSPSFAPCGINERHFYMMSEELYSKNKLIH